jgi:hypothetical protein
MIPKSGNRFSEKILRKQKRYAIPIKTAIVATISTAMLAATTVTIRSPQLGRRPAILLASA